MHVAVPPSDTAGLGEAFGPSVRLTRSRDFKHVFEGRYRIAGTTMVIWIRATEQGEGIRAGVVASKRTFRRAVDRNRAKRLLREAFRRERPHLVGSANMVLVARRHIVDTDSKTVRQEFKKMAKALGLVPDGAEGASA